MDTLPRILDGLKREEAAGLARLLQRCNRKEAEQEDVQALQEWLRKEPDLWRVCGSLARDALTAMNDAWSANTLVRESLQAGQQALRQELGIERASPLERMLIEHVVLCWTRLQMAEKWYTTRHLEGVSLDVGRYWESRLSAIQYRYLRAVETLARIRRLGLAVVQVNIADKQVNVVGQPPENHLTE